MSSTEAILIKTHFDISPTWHERYPNILARFVESFGDPVVICGDARRMQLGLVERVELRGHELHGEVRWFGKRPAGYVHMNWAFGPGEKVSLSSGFMGPYPHHENFNWIEHEEYQDP